MGNKKMASIALIVFIIIAISLSFQLYTKININTATHYELIDIYGIGDVRANKIIEYRNKHKIDSFDELIKIEGIGAKTIDEIRENCYIGW